MTRNGSFAWIAALLLAAAIVSLAVVLRDVPSPFGAPAAPASAMRPAEPLVLAGEGNPSTTHTTLESRLETLSRGLVAARGAGDASRSSSAQLLPLLLVLLGGIGLGAGAMRLALRRRAVPTPRPVERVAADAVKLSGFSARVPRTTEAGAEAGLRLEAEPEDETAEPSVGNGAATGEESPRPAFAAFGRWLSAAGRTPGSGRPSETSSGDDAGPRMRDELAEDDEDDEALTALEPNAIDLRHRGGLLPWSHEARQATSIDPAVEERLRALERTMLRLEQKLDELSDAAAAATVAKAAEDESRLARFSHRLIRVERGDAETAASSAGPVAAVGPSTADASRLHRAVQVLANDGWTESRIADRLDLEPEDVLVALPGSRRRRAS